ncbi:MAG TPA: hypothetical protein VIP48_17750 [Streptosporangiaceae bacterium]
MDQAARDDIAAAVAAHHELGRDFDGAVTEGLIERIGAEIDKRVDARLAGTQSRRARKRAARTAQPAEPAKATPDRPVPAHPDTRRGYWTGVFVGAALTGVPAVLAHEDQMQWVVGVWAVLAVVYFLATWVHRRRES